MHFKIFIDLSDGSLKRLHLKQSICFSISSLTQPIIKYFNGGQADVENYIKIFVFFVCLFCSSLSQTPGKEETKCRNTDLVSIPASTITVWSSLFPSPHKH